MKLKWQSNELKFWNEFVEHKKTNTSYFTAHAQCVLNKVALNLKGTKHTEKLPPKLRQQDKKSINHSVNSHSKSTVYKLSRFPEMGQDN